jgi:hypothetical protein
MNQIKHFALGLVFIAASLQPGAVVKANELRVYPDAGSVLPLAPGKAVPSVMVKTVGGDVVDLREVVASTGALLVFYRGGW